MRTSTWEADCEQIPDLPDEHTCPLCGLAVWAATNELGKTVKLDASRPMRVPVSMPDMLGGVRLERDRADYRFASAKTMNGWRLLDPVHVRSGDDAGWHWYVTRAPLAAIGPGDLVFSEHVYTCTKNTSRAVVGQATATCRVGATAGDPRRKQSGARVRVDKAREGERLSKWIRSGALVPLLSERPGLELCDPIQESLFPL